MTTSTSLPPMLNDESLSRKPEEVFDIIGKLGEGSYGAVYKGRMKEGNDMIAVKQIPMENDLEDILKEVSIMQQCHHPHIVKYYGSYFKGTDMWICMELCGAGSVTDVMRLRKKVLKEPQIANILYQTLLGLDFLHTKKLMIHRDIKAGNILLNTKGIAKLADFGVTGQLQDATSKRNTVIGTPFWMAPEVIQEIGHDTKADIWSLGITIIEMAQGRPPHSDVHPMRAIFMIPTRPPPTLTCKHSPEMADFLAQCVVKNPAMRADAATLLQHALVVAATDPSVLSSMVSEAAHIIETKGLDYEDDEEIEAPPPVSPEPPKTTGHSKKAKAAAAAADKAEKAQKEKERKEKEKKEKERQKEEPSEVGEEDFGTTVISGTMLQNDTMIMGTMVVSDTMVESGTAVMTDTAPGPSQAAGLPKPSFMQFFSTIKQEVEEEKAASRTTKKEVPLDEQLGANMTNMRLDELLNALKTLDDTMGTDMHELRDRYETKKRPLLLAMKKKGAQ